MNFLTKLFQKITALLTGKKRELDVSEIVLQRYPDAVFVQDVFPSSILNVEFIVLPSVDADGVPEDLKDVIKRKDGYVTFVFTGTTADTIIALQNDPVSLAEILAEKLLGMTTIDEAVLKIMDQLTEAFNKILPQSKKLTADALQKKVLGMAAALLKRSDTFASAKELYAALLAAIIKDGKVAIMVPDSVEAKLAKLGLTKLAEKNDATALLVKLLEGQINNILESALKNLKGEVTVY